MEGRHTGEVNAAMTDTMINDIEGLQYRTLKTMTTDAASNMRKAMKESMVIDTHFRCLAHVINICFVKALEQETVAQSIQKCKALAAATHRSTQKN